MSKKSEEGEKKSPETRVCRSSQRQQQQPSWCPLCWSIDSSFPRSSLLPIPCSSLVDERCCSCFCLPSLSSLHSRTHKHTSLPSSSLSLPSSKPAFNGFLSLPASASVCACVCPLQGSRLQRRRVAVRVCVRVSLRQASLLNCTSQSNPGRCSSRRHVCTCVRGCTRLLS